MSTESLFARLIWARYAMLRRLDGLASGGRDRGDVPGWVMITVMTAALVIAILVPFRRAIVGAINRALSQVVGS